MKKLKFALFLFSPMCGQLPNNPNAYRQTQHAPLDTREEMKNFARRTLKVEENLSGKTAFQIRPVSVQV